MAMSGVSAMLGKCKTEMKAALLKTDKTMNGVWDEAYVDA